MYLLGYRIYSVPGHISGEKNDLKGCMDPSVYCNTVYNSHDMEAA